MGKKLILLGMAIAAFAVPAAASASPVLTSSDNPGVPIGLGSEIVGFSENAVTENTALETLTCEEVEIEAEVSENTGSSIKTGGIGPGRTAGCEAGGLPLTITSPKLVTLSTSGSSHTGTLTLSFTADVGPIQCPFSGTGEFTYETGVGVLHIPGVKLAGPAICEPEEGSPVFSGDFAISTSNGAAVFIS